MSRLHIVNPGNRERWSRWRYRGTQRYVLWFDQYAPVFIMVWERSLEAALETAAAYLAEHAPGHLISDETMAERLRDACAERGFTPDDIDWSDLRGDHAEAVEAAEADTTYTESGRLQSEDWGIQFDEHSDRADLKTWIAELEARHYGDGPAVLHPGNA